MDLNLMDALVLIAGAALSIGFEYIPRLREWYNGLGDTAQQGLMALLVFAAAVVIFGLSCAGWMADLWPALAVSCDQAGAIGLMRAFLMAIAVNQGVFRLLPKTDSKRNDHPGLFVGGYPGDDQPAN